MINQEELIDYYYYGWELSKSEDKFPDWFFSESLKYACLLGYCDQDLGVVKEKEEILKELGIVK